MLRILGVILAVCLSVSAAVAGLHDTYLKKAADLAWLGDASALLAHFETPAFEKAVADPDALHKLAMTLDMRIRILTVRGCDAVDGVLGALLPHAEALLEKEPNAARAAYIWAALTTAQQRSRCLRGGKPDLSRWNKAIWLAQLVYAGGTQKKASGVQILGWIGQLVAQKDADEAALLKFADEIVKELLALDPKDRAVLAAEGQLFLDKARAALARRRKKDAQALVEAGLATLERHIEAGDTEKTLGRAHTELVTFANDANLGIKTPYLVESGVSRLSLVPYTVPAASSWEAGNPGHATQILAISQFGPEGRATRALVLRAFQHGTPYDAAGTGVGVDGSNAKGLAAAYSDTMYRALTATTKKRPVKRGRAGKGWPKGQYFRHVGTDATGRWVRKTVAFVSSKRLGHTIQLIVSEYEDETAPDSEFLFVLKSLTIPN